MQSFFSHPVSTTAVPSSPASASHLCTCLQCIQKTAAPLFTRSSWRSHITPFFSLFALPLCQVQSVFQGSGYHLWGPALSGTMLTTLTVPHAHLQTKGNQTFEVVAPTYPLSLELQSETEIWDLRSETSVEIFKAFDDLMRHISVICYFLSVFTWSNWHFSLMFFNYLIFVSWHTSFLNCFC